jgi:hypothetical protein
MCGSILSIMIFILGELMQYIGDIRNIQLLLENILTVLAKQSNAMHVGVIPNKLEYQSKMVHDTNIILHYGTRNYHNGKASNQTFQTKLKLGVYLDPTIATN